jgi:hypothetical protein
MSKKYSMVASLGGLALASLLVLTPAMVAAQADPAGPNDSADQINQTKQVSDSVNNPANNHANKPVNSQRGIIGTVSSVDVSAINLTAKNGTPYVVDATNAKVMKAGSTVQISAIQAGDTLMVRGAIVGSVITAKTIIDGLPFAKKGTSSGINGTKKKKGTNNGTKGNPKKGKTNKTSTKKHKAKKTKTPAPVPTPVGQ